MSWEDIKEALMSHEMALIMALIAAICVFCMIFTSFRVTDYATGEPFFVSGQVVKKEGSAASRVNHCIVVETEDAMPDGSHSFVTREVRDFLMLSGYEGKHVTILFDEKGFVAAVA